jgi:hypothetical protein
VALDLQSYWQMLRSYRSLLSSLDLRVLIINNLQRGLQWGFGKGEQKAEYQSLASKHSDSIKSSATLVP